MTLIELKKSIHEKIDGVNDEHLLEEVAAILTKNENVFIIPEHMKEGIRQGQEDIKNGRIHTMEDFEKKYEKWLKES
jgi:hypothetical protein